MSNPYAGWKVYGPYLHKKMQRKMVVLVSESDHTVKTSTSYARYLMSNHLGRILEDWEEVDHIDNDALNDDVANFQILTRPQNTAKRIATQTRKMIKLACPQCEIVFTKEYHQTHWTKGGRPTCCSRSCAGKYQHVS